ncbi:hypothetical protein D3C71_21080 [compost metagenome]
MATRTLSSTAPDATNRVRAFRERLAEDSYRRVEGYVAEDEKARIETVKKDLGVTMDVAVAGLLRLGLQAYEQACGPRASAVQAHPRLDLAITGSSLQGPVAQCNSVAAAVPLFAGASSPALLFAANEQAAVSQAVACPAPLPSASASESPIAHFFQRRKGLSR